MPCFDEKENNDYFLLSDELVEPVLFLSSHGAVSGALWESSARTWPLKYFCP